MKNGIEKVTKSKLDDSIKEKTSADDVPKIHNSVWPAYDSCVQKVSSSTPDVAGQFKTCIDQLIKNTGAQVVSYKIENTKALTLTFSPTEIAKLSSDKSLQFKNCFQDLAAKNKRTPDGMVDTSLCERVITNDLTYQAIVKKFQQSAVDAVKGTTINPEQLGQEGKKILDRCWKADQTGDKREECLRISLIEFSKTVADKRLDLAIPSDISTKKKIKTDALVTFKACLEKALPAAISTEEHLSEKMEPCTNQLMQAATASTVEASIDQALAENLKDQKDLNLSAQRSQAKKEIMESFHQCAAKNKDPAPCADEVKKVATRVIALAAARASRSQQLPDASVAPSAEYLAAENDLKICTNNNLIGTQLDKRLDECKKKFIIEVARTLGIDKFKDTIKGLLGEDKFKTSSSEIAVILAKYNSCLDNLYKVDNPDINTCTDQLSKNGELFFKDSMKQWMSEGEKDAATIAIKAKFVDFLPCLSGLLPSNSSPAAKVEKDTDPFMKVLAKAIAQYIEYSPDNAKQNLNDIMNQFSKDLKASADTATARRNLVDTLYKNGAFDQFLKSYVRKMVMDAFANTPDSEMPKALKEALTSKDNFDAIFSSPEGSKVKEAVLHQLINPLVIDGKSSSSPEIVAGTAAVTQQVTQLLVNSPKFGEKIIATQVQGSLDSTGWLSKTYVKVFLGGSDSFKWDKVRQTPSGKIAEDYIKQNIMTPKFNHITLSAEETKKINDEAERLVAEAVKGYKEPTP